jgi:hypothetical protein
VEHGDVRAVEVGKTGCTLASAQRKSLLLVAVKGEHVQSAIRASAAGGPRLRHERADGYEGDRRGRRPHATS